MYEKWKHCIDVWRQIVIWPPNLEFRKTSIFIFIWSFDFTSFIRSTMEKNGIGSLIRRCKISPCFKRNIIIYFKFRAWTVWFAQKGKIPGTQEHRPAVINPNIAIRGKKNWILSKILWENWYFLQIFLGSFLNFQGPKRCMKSSRKYRNAQEPIEMASINYTGPLCFKTEIFIIA